MRRLNQKFSENPLAWIVFALFVMAEYQLYKRGSELTLVCSQLYQASTPLYPKATDRGRAERVCIDRNSD